LEIINYPSFSKALKRLRKNEKNDDEINDKLTLLAFGSHENFYRDLKKKV